MSRRAMGCWAAGRFGPQQFIIPCPVPRASRPRSRCKFSGRACRNCPIFHLFRVPESCLAFTPWAPPNGENFLQFARPLYHDLDCPNYGNLAWVPSNRQPPPSLEWWSYETPPNRHQNTGVKRVIPKIKIPISPWKGKWNCRMGLRHRTRPRQ